MHETYDLTNLETKVNTNRYMRWHTTFSHNITSVLCENVVSDAEQEIKTMDPTNIGTTPMYMTCHYPHHRPNDGIASQDGISQHVVLFPGTLDMCA